ncbi:hypothetical protein PanWU01x14_053320, partial [Parasponia andersonii]
KPESHTVFSLAGKELSSVDKLFVLNGCSWQVGLEQGSNRIWFHQG